MTPSGLQDFWRVYDAHYEDIAAQTLLAVEHHPEFGPIIRATPADQLVEQNRRSRELMRAAIAGDRGPYEADLRAQGAAYAVMGVSFSGWYDVVREFQRFIVPLLFKAYGAESERLMTALSSMQSFLDKAMGILGEEYLKTKEALVAEQRELVAEREEVLDYLVDGVTLYDREGRHLSINPAAERLNHRPRAELLGKVVWEVFPDVVGNPFHQAFQRVATQGGHAQFEMHYPAWNRWYEVQVYAVKRGVVAITRDITERKLAEQTGQFFTLALDMLGITNREGYFVRVNPAFDVLGYTDGEFLARPFIDFVHPDDVAKTLAEVEKLATGALSMHFENRYRCKDGSYRTILWSAAPGPGGTIYAAGHDITERKRVERERTEFNFVLSQRNDELVRASRAKSDFLAMMSHELRTPLNSIIGFSEVLIDGKFGPLNEKQGRYINNVHQSGKHLLGLINDLLDLSKIEAGRLEMVTQPCAPRALVADAAATLQPIAEKGKIRLQLDDDAAPQVPAVRADSARLKQVLYNLLSNAIKFSPPGGAVSVGCAQSPDGKAVRITVADQGPGISAEDAKRLFTPFTQLANAKELGGTGLGLALTKQLVELMGGQIGLESTPGAGATFFVDLPADATPRPSSSPDVGVAKEAPLVLVVDDDPGSQELLALMLQGGGYRTEVVGSGEEAVAAARRLQPDLITLDVLLPTIDGWDVLRILQSDPLTAQIPVIMVTIASDRKMAFSLGAIEHLVKPIERQVLLETLARRSFTTKVKERPIHVLAVDDDPQQLELVRATLEPHGFQVHTAATGREGLEAARRGPTDLLLLDLVLPDISGVEVVSLLRGDPRTEALPILLVTAHELSPAERARLNGDVIAVIAKGSQRAEHLLAEVTSVLRPRP